MKLTCYSLFDRKALQYHPPFHFSTDGQAVRALADLVEDANTTVGRHPSDFVLYCIGTFDDSKGAMEPFSPLRHVIDAIALVKLQPALPFPVPGQPIPSVDHDPPPQAGNLSNGKAL